MQVNWVFGGVVSHLEHVVSNLNLQQIVQHLRLGLSAATVSLHNILTAMTSNYSFIADRTTAHSHRLLASYCHLFVCLSVCRCLHLKFVRTQLQTATLSYSTQLNSSLLKHGSRMAKRDTVNKNK